MKREFLDYVEDVIEAMSNYRSGKGDFSDYYLGRANERAGAKVTLSFDTALKGEPRFQILVQ